MQINVFYWAFMGLAIVLAMVLSVELAVSVLFNITLFRLRANAKKMHPKSAFPFMLEPFKAWELLPVQMSSAFVFFNSDELNNRFLDSAFNIGSLEKLKDSRLAVDIRKVRMLYRYLGKLGVISFSIVMLMGLLVVVYNIWSGDIT